MLIAKIVGTAWMLGWFFIILKFVINRVAQGSDLFGCLFALVMTWLLIGFAPVAIAKFGWDFIK